MKINKKYTKCNHTALKRTKQDIGFIVVHYVGALGDAKANAEYYASTYVGASADFYVGHTGDIWQGNDYFNYYAWHCGGGYQSNWTINGAGAYYGKCTNKNSVGIEMCVHKKSTRSMQATDGDWFFEDATVKATAQLVAKLMKDLDIDINHVITHFSVNKKICPSPWVVPNSIGGGSKAWDSFKSLVMSYYGGQTPEPVTVIDWYRVGTAWVNGQCVGQLGAYQYLENAKADCPPGYKVFDVTGKIIYENKSEGGTQSADFATLTEQQAAAKILELARAEGIRAHILPSLIAAQAILESGYCRATELVKTANNCFGMKVKLSGNTWESVWDGVSKVKIRTPEQDEAGHTYYIYADFRKYPCIEKSFEDHSCYLLGAMDGSKKRYAGLTQCKGYREAITLVKRGGYATDVDYISKLCRIVERYGLDKYDGEVSKLSPAEKEPDVKPVPGSGTTVYRIQIGKFELRANAEKFERTTEKLGYDAFVEQSGKDYYVYAGSFQSKVNADKRLREVKALGNEYKGAFIKEVTV